jgi:transposase
MREQVILTVKEQQRLLVLTEIDAGRITGQEAAQLMGLSVRQVRRLLAAYRQHGVEAVAHGNRGRAATRRTPEVVRDQVLLLARTTYLDYNDQHFSEELAAQHGLVLSRSTVRRLRREAGLGSPRHRRRPQHRRRRVRYPQARMLLQVDGSDHDWLEGRGPRLTLLAAIDDATNEVPYALFRAQEDAAGYFLLLRQIAASHGLPLALYADRHTIFQSPGTATLAQQLRGEAPQSQFGRLLAELSIQLIAARSPQAKGRVERLFGTLQDRLVKALRQANASSDTEANAVLLHFLPAFNARFTLPAAQPGSQYRPWPTTLQADEAFCFKHERTVANDNTISFHGVTLHIPRGPDRISYAKARVQVRQYLDGRVGICYHNQILTIIQTQPVGPLRVGQLGAIHQALEPAPPEPDPQPIESADQPSKRPRKPAADHPWRRPLNPERAARQHKGDISIEQFG